MTDPTTSPAPERNPTMPKTPNTEDRAAIIATGLAPSDSLYDQGMAKLPPPSPKQRAYIASLQAQALGTQQSDADLCRLTKREASIVIDLLKGLAPPSPKQASFWAALASERGYDPARLEAEAKVLGTWTRKDISTAIDSLKGQPKAAPTSGATAAASTLDAGQVHQRPDGTLVRVSRSRNTDSLYGKSRDPQALGWTYEGRAILRDLDAGTLLTPEQARALGARWGVCAICGRKLTVEASIQDGIGPVCKKRVDGWHQPVTLPVDIHVGTAVTSAHAAGQAIDIHVNTPLTDATKEFVQEVEEAIGQGPVPGMGSPYTSAEEVMDRLARKYTGQDFPPVWEGSPGAQGEVPTVSEQPKPEPSKAPPSEYTPSTKRRVAPKLGG